MGEQRCSWCSAPIPHGTEHVAVSYLQQVTQDGCSFDVVSAPAIDCVVWCLACTPAPEDVTEALAAIRHRRPADSGAATAARPRPSPELSHISNHKESR